MVDNDNGKKILMCIESIQYMFFVFITVIFSSVIIISMQYTETHIFGIFVFILIVTILVDYLLYFTKRHKLKKQGDLENGRQ